MKKIYAFMAVASLALSASAAPHFSNLFAKPTDGKVDTPLLETVTITEAPSKEFKMNTVKNQIKTTRVSRAEEMVCPEIAPTNLMYVTNTKGELKRNFFFIEQTGDTTISISDWFYIYSNIVSKDINATYKVVTYTLKDESTVDYPTVTIPSGTIVATGEFEDGTFDLGLYYCDDQHLYKDSIEFLVDDLGNLIPMYDGLGFFLGHETEANSFSGVQFNDPEFMGIRGIQEAKLAAINGDSNGFDFTNAGIDQNGEEYPFSWYINYAYVENEEGSTLYISNFGYSEYLAPFTLEGEDAFVDGAYYMYDLVSNTTGEVVDKAFMVTGTLDGLEFQALGGGCVGFIDYSVADTAVINIEGIWGGVTDEEDFGLMPVEIGEGLYSFFSDSKVELWGFSNPNSGISAVSKDENTNAPVEYYNLQGMKVANPAAGQVVIKKQGNKTSKIFIR